MHLVLSEGSLCLLASCSPAELQEEEGEDSEAERSCTWLIMLIGSKSIFQASQDLSLLAGLHVVTTFQRLSVPQDTDTTNKEECVGVGSRKDAGIVPEMSDRMCCSTCQCPFDSREEQTEHYKLDWHRFNLRQRLMGGQPVTAEEFEKKTGAVTTVQTGHESFSLGLCFHHCDVSSISGSDSDTDSESNCDLLRPVNIPGSNPVNQEQDRGKEQEHLSHKVLFRNSEGQYLSVYRCILLSKKESEENNNNELVSSLQNVNVKSPWVILMTGGGHFAGAVFKGNEVLHHKTFHRYTVRAKRGTAQGMRDAQNRSHAPKSAGASLRRYNEAALTKDIQDLLENWAEHLREASVIFLRAPSYNKGIFFSGKTPPLVKDDPRVRTIPFATKRATFKEVRRVHELLTTLQIYGKETEIADVISPRRKVWKKLMKAIAKETTDSESNETVIDEDSGEESPAEEMELEMVEMTLGTLHLREYEVFPKRKKKKKKKEEEEEVKTTPAAERFPSEEEIDADKEVLPVQLPASDTTGNKAQGRRKTRKNREDLIQSLEQENKCYQLKNDLYTACKTGDTKALQLLLQGLLQPASGSADAALIEPKDSGRDCPSQNQKAPSEGNQTGFLEPHEEAKKRDGETGNDDGGISERKGETDSTSQRKDVDANSAARDECCAQGSAVDSGAQLVPDCGAPEVLVTTSMLNEKIDEAGFTLLHVAAAAGQRDVVRLLMDSGCDPALRDKRGQPPYCVSVDKETRNEFRKYMADHLDKYDYGKAQVPGPLTTEIEAKKAEKKAEKKKAQKAQKKQREKEEKEERKRKEEEDQEKKRYAALGEREKRALAAERRFAQQMAAIGTTLTNIRRCWQCGESLLGKTPFQYLDFSFCTTKCLQEHKRSRAAQP
ncbi:tRNA endonuclease ANKZF1 isoform X2 [Latimeria chalumnae]|uniref:tRNA endonuclease ANKZF1 isoform X2 n=1 Tax=Latimeria chalumnae TaxID=7897 RepID=UPI0003C1679B|nr:PREDICTED: ankyrin repeat and zinc finger domain-containing protein 1 isoform X2 [Latimeria chalumnae]|eukprot:XP_006004357.1 PREDICTED: ankyrin repeat and zinc finger domain-containing protein 1 isoform X2 [Latimeria chalumnae]